MAMSMRPRRPLRPMKAKKCQFCADSSMTVDYKSASQLRRFISERGKILSRRHTGNCARHQRVVAEHIQRARYMALIYYTADQLR
ncbi:MAG TPA: 30S ribosomal protein S18 [Abditibacteriaceae bacterium]|nr:30S ribosomal protein S18 [Abditibacteriaceae bacterium]